MAIVRRKKILTHKHTLKDLVSLWTGMTWVKYCSSYFTEALGHILYLNLVKSCGCTGMKQDGIPAPTNRIRGSKQRVGRKKLSHGICSLHWHMTGKPMQLLRWGISPNIQSYSCYSKLKVALRYLVRKVSGWENGS